MRVASVPTWEIADIVVKNSVWGSKRPRFDGWLKGEVFVLLVGQQGVVVARVAGPAYVADAVLWKESLFEYRVPLRVERVMRGSEGESAGKAVRRALTEGLGGIYGTYIISQTRLTEAVEDLVQSALLS